MQIIGNFTTDIKLGVTIRRLLPAALLFLKMKWDYQMF